MAVFFFHHVSRRRSQIMGRRLGRRLRAMRVRLSKKRRVIRHMRQTLEDQQIAAAEIEAWNRRIRKENQLVFLSNTLVDKWARDLLNGFDDDP